MDADYAQVERELSAYEKKRQASNWHNDFHLDMPCGLINDPNGLCQYNGEIYIFYQWNPFGSTHKNKHWGLVRTKDFLHYTRPQLALYPDCSWDKDGCYSGCAVGGGGRLELFYTGNVRGADGRRQARQIRAVFQDGRAQKLAAVIPAPPAGYTAHFRDPFHFVWRGREYLVIGAQSQELRGCAAIYERSADEWLYKGRLQTALKDFGYMWECPNLIALPDGNAAFLFCPQGLAKEEMRFQNAHQSGYVIGALDMEKLCLQHGDFYEFDSGFDFYAPQVFDCDGEKTMIGWGGMPDRDGEYPSDREGWRCALTLPRVLKEKNGRLYQMPHPALEKLRRHRTELTAGNCRIVIPRRCAELDLTFSLRGETAPRILWQMGSERIVLSYERQSGRLTLDRRNMKLGGRGIRKCHLTDASRLALKVFIDKSMLEIFVNDGADVMTAAYFPETSAMELSFTGLAQGCVYELGALQIR